MMVSELLRQIADAVLAGAGVDAIDEAIIDPAPLDQEQKSVLWLYAQALQERRSPGMLPEREPALTIGARQAHSSRSARCQSRSARC